MRPPLAVMRMRSRYRDVCDYDKPGTMKGLLNTNFGGVWGPGVRHPTKKNPKGIHQGWDLYAAELTPALAIMDGRIARTENNPSNATGLGRYVILEFTWNDPRTGIPRTLFALYAHLGKILSGKGAAKEGQTLGLTGRSGNAVNGPPHLHFAIMTSDTPTRGLSNTISPGDVIGYQWINLDELSPWTDFA